MLPQERAGLVSMFAAVLCTLTVSVLGEVTEGVEVRSRCGAALKKCGVPYRPLCWCGGPSPSFVTGTGWGWTKAHPGNQHGFVLPLSPLVLNKTHEAEEEAVSPFGPASHWQVSAHSPEGEWSSSEPSVFIQHWF